NSRCASIAFRLRSSSFASSSIWLPVFGSTWTWYPACEALVGESASESFINRSLRAANFGESEPSGACVAGVSGSEPEGSSASSESSAQNTKMLGAGIKNPPETSEKCALAAAKSGENAVRRPRKLIHVDDGGVKESARDGARGSRHHLFTRA